MARPTQAPNRSRPQGTVSTSSPHSSIFCWAEVGKMRIRIGGNMRLFPLLLLLSALVFLRSVGGPDYGRYEEWAEALLRGSAASIESSTVSPSGMPVSAAAHGTGVVLGIFHLLYPPFFSASLSARCVGVALFLISSLALWGILDAIELQHRLKLLVYSLFLAGTNFGYYFIYSL